VFNQGKTLDAVLRCIEAREASNRVGDFRFPEHERHAAPIELVCKIGGSHFAFEHTGVEPFSDHIEMGIHHRRFFEPIENQLTNTLSTKDHFQLLVPVNATVGLRPAKIELIQNALLAWVWETGPKLKLAPYGHYKSSIMHFNHPDIPFEISLSRFEAIEEMRGTFHANPVASGDVEEARYERVRISCEKKFPKLNHWKEQEGARTVLVLEAADAWLTNEMQVAKAVGRAEEGRNDKPDEIFLVDTHHERFWWVSCLRREESRSCEDEGFPARVDSETLLQLTER
jgi:hypothetical protein